MKNFIRAIQTYFPRLHDARFNLKFKLAKIFNKPHESDFKALSYFQPEQDEIFIDIGSNRGEAILSMLLEKSLQNEVVGFEPNPLIFDKLYKYYSSEERVEVKNIGIGEEVGEFDLYVPFYRKWMFDGLSSFKKLEAEDWLKTRLWNFKQKHFSIKKVNCLVTELDSFNFKPYFIKIDVQGFELEVLKGAKQTLEKYEPILLIESIDEPTMKLLSQYRYEFYSYESKEFKKGTGELNTFCITPSKFSGLKK